MHKRERDDLSALSAQHACLKRTSEQGRYGNKGMVAWRTKGRASVDGNGGSDSARHLEATEFPSHEIWEEVTRTASKR